MPDPQQPLVSGQGPQGYRIENRPDGKYLVYPEGFAIPASALTRDQPQLASTPAMTLLDFATNPELLAFALPKAAAVAFPEAAGPLTQFGGPLVGGTSAVLKDVVKGERDPGSLMGDFMLHAGINAVPGLAGAWMAGMKRSESLAKALQGMSGDSNFVGTIAKGLKGALGLADQTVDPAVAAAAAGGAKNAGFDTQMQLLLQKLQDPNLNATAKAAVLQAVRALQGRMGAATRTVTGLGTTAASIGRQLMDYINPAPQPY